MPLTGNSSSIKIAVWVRALGTLFGFPDHFVASGSFETFSFFSISPLLTLNSSWCQLCFRVSGTQARPVAKKPTNLSGFYFPQN